MRKFIMSDIHGFGNVYYSMMAYLDNLSKEDEIELYINGDLFDRGYESAEILLDIKKRIEENKYKIVYLGGNHELMMHDFFKDEKNNRRNPFNDWYENGGYMTISRLEEIFNHDDNKMKEIVEFISNLKIYHIFDEKINNKPILLVHAACPEQISNKTNMQIKDDNIDVFNSVWKREHDISYVLGIFKSIDPKENKIGNKDYFTIIGHTPVDNKYGFHYQSKQNYLNIDGGCAYYASGVFKYNHFPLVEVMNNKLRILTFNSNNEIIYGNYFMNNIIIPIKDEELNVDREYLDNDLVMNKLFVNDDGIVLYKKK